MPNGGRIERAWRGFEELVIPATADDAQRSEMRKAFFGGAGILFEMMSATADLDFEQANAILEELHDELHGFGCGLDAEILHPLISGGGEA